MIVLRLGLRLLSLVAVLALVVVAVTGLRVWQVGRTDERPTSDAIVVLGAAQFDGRPSGVFERRLEHAYILWDQGVAPEVVTLGGRQPSDRFTEAEAGARWLNERGVPAAQVRGVGEGGDTLTSLRAFEDMYRAQGWDSVVLVTDPTHSLRARTMARDLGIDAHSSPAVVSPDPAEDGEGLSGSHAEYLARETAALLYYRVVGDMPDA